MRLLGIDYGSRKIGLALTNDEGAFATPYRVIPTNDKVMKTILTIIKEKNVKKIVIGDSLNFKREENPIMKKIKPFAKELGDRAGLPVYFMDETLTSAAARREQEADAMLDARAAALLLESFIAHAKRG